MLQTVSATKNQPTFPHPAPKGGADAAASPWARSNAHGPGKAAMAPPADGVVQPRMSDDAQRLVMQPLSRAEHMAAGQLAQAMSPRQWASPNFDPTRPSVAIGPSTGTHYSFTCCPTNTPNPLGQRFTADDLLGQAFRSNARTIVSLTSQGDMRHSEYYKSNKHGGAYSVASSGRPSFSHQVRNADGTPATISIFNNSVRDNRTGEARQIKMVHVNGWRDQTALSADAQMSMIAKLKDHLSNDDMRSMVVHCSEGRNRTGSFTTMMEGMDAATKGRRPNIPGALQWFQSVRVPDAVYVPQQLQELGKSEVMLGRVSRAQQQQPRHPGGWQQPRPHRAFG